MPQDPRDTQQVTGVGLGGVAENMVRCEPGTSVEDTACDKSFRDVEATVFE